MGEKVEKRNVRKGKIGNPCEKAFKQENEKKRISFKQILRERNPLWKNLWVFNHIFRKREKNEGDERKDKDEKRETEKKKKRKEGVHQRFQSFYLFQKYVVYVLFLTYKLPWALIWLMRVGKY